MLLQELPLWGKNVAKISDSWVFWLKIPKYVPFWAKFWDVAAQIWPQ